jgi:hypothetical protein
MVLLAYAVASAAPNIELGADAGFTQGAPDARALQLGTDLRIRTSPVFAVATTAWGQQAVHRLAPSGIVGLTREVLLAEWTDPTPTHAHGGLGLQALFTPFAGSVGSRPLAIDLGFGPGLVRTVDDPVALQCDASGRCDATLRQWHPAVAWSAGARVGVTDRTALSLGVDGRHWIEVLEGVRLERMGSLTLGAGLIVGLSRAREPVVVASD